MVPHHKKPPQPDDEQRELDCHNANDKQDPKNRARSLQMEELSIHSQGDKTKNNKTSVILKTSSARRVMHLELKALKEHEELQTRLGKLEREAKQLEREEKKRGRTCRRWKRRWKRKQADKNRWPTRPEMLKRK